tara:strand:+ start:336 stop:599 length:264 start_codon:yes stop_codon:yes gene_type:complete
MDKKLKDELWNLHHVLECIHADWYKEDCGKRSLQALKFYPTVEKVFTEINQDKIMKDVLWEFVSDKDIPEINKMFEEELAKLRGEDE